MTKGVEGGLGWIHKAAEWGSIWIKGNYGASRLVVVGGENRFVFIGTGVKISICWL